MIPDHRNTGSVLGLAPDPVCKPSTNLVLSLLPCLKSPLCYRCGYLAWFGGSDFQMPAFPRREGARFLCLFYPAVLSSSQSSCPLPFSLLLLLFLPPNWHQTSSPVSGLIRPPSSPESGSCRCHSFFHALWPAWLPAGLWVRDTCSFFSSVSFSLRKVSWGQQLAQSQRAQTWVTECTVQAGRGAPENHPQSVSDRMQEEAVVVKNSSLFLSISKAHSAQKNGNHLPFISASKYSLMQKSQQPQSLSLLHTGLTVVSPISL